MPAIAYRWLTPEEITTLVNPSCRIHGMSELNPAGCRVLGAFNGDVLVKSFAIQLHPVLGPLLTHDNTYRDAGDISRELTNQMHDYLDDSQARGYLVICDNPITERLCQRHGMKRLDSPVYLAVEEHPVVN